MDVGAAERPLSEERAGGELQTMNGTDAPDARRSSSGTGIEKGDAISAAATRSTRRASVPERHRPPANEHPEPARPQANRHPALEAPPLCPKSGGELQEALKELICGDGLNLGRDFRGSREGSVGRCSEKERTRQHLATGRGGPWETQGQGQLRPPAWPRPLRPALRTAGEPTWTPAFLEGTAGLTRAYREPKRPSPGGLSVLAAHRLPTFYLN